LFSHFHDILPGSGVHDTRTYTHGLFQEIMAITGTAETDALRRVAALVDTRLPGHPALEIQPAWTDHSSFGAGVGFASVNGGVPQSDQSHGSGPRPFVIFNPTARDRHEVIEVTIWDNGEFGNADWKTKQFVVHAPDGAVIPAQHIKSGRYWSHEYLTLSFPVNVPGFGYARYVVAEADTPATPAEPVARQVGYAHHCSYAPIERSIEGLENDRLRVEFDPITGGIRSLVDKVTGLQLIDRPTSSPILEYGVERAHTFTAWTVDHTGSIELPTVTALRREHQDGHRASIVFDMKIRASTMRVTYELRAGDPRLHIGIKGTWFERGTADTGIPVLRMVFPLALSDARGRYEIPFGAADRAFNRGEELPALQWAQVTGVCAGQPAGCLLLNDSKHGHSLDGSTLRLTLIRSSYDPDPLPDIGEHDVNVALYPFADELPVADAIAMGQEYNHPLRAVSTDTHDGNLKPTGQFFNVTPSNVTVMSIKKSEATNALLVRLLNPTGEPVTARITLSKQIAGKIASAQEVDLIERPVRESRLKLAANAVTLTVPANSPSTVAIRMAK
jgi:alpha-mannosidase